MKNPIVITIVVAVIVGAISFYGGIQYQKTQQGNFRNDGQGNFMMGQGGLRNGGANGQSGQRGMMGQGFRPVIGEIISADDKSITIKLEDGSSKIVLLNDSVNISKSDSGSKADLKVGAKVGVFGQDNNGTISAQNIQLNPQTRLSSPSASPQ